VSAMALAQDNSGFEYNESLYNIAGYTGILIILVCTPLSILLSVVAYIRHKNILAVIAVILILIPFILSLITGLLYFLTSNSSS